MNRIIKKVAVLGSGVMGSRIACHFANAGMEVLLLDIVPKELTEVEIAKNISKDSPVFRNRIVNQALTSALKSNPSPIYKKEFASRITTGNFEDDFERISEMDWILEAVIENLAIKQKVFESVDKYRKSGSLVTSNTSGIPINLMAAGRTEDFRKHFCGTHFFNPPRYLSLLEIIPTAETAIEVFNFHMNFGDLMLGKTTVGCKDTPAFIANRVGIYAIMEIFHTMKAMQITVEELDAMTGPLVGRPKSATCRTIDVIGLDTLVKVAHNLHEVLKDDYGRDLFMLPDFLQKLNDNKWLGDKTKQGFYKKVKQDGKSGILALNLDTFEYAPKSKPKFKALEAAKMMDTLSERLVVIYNSKDKAGEFFRKTNHSLFRYVADKIPEIADELYRIDLAVKTGFGWEMGPFEIWDELGVKKVVDTLRFEGHKMPVWIDEFIASGNTHFYRNEKGLKKYYDIPTKEYKLIPGQESLIILDQLRSSNVIQTNPGATLFDLGDGVLGVEFHTKMNAIGGEITQMIHAAIETAEKDGWKGIVIGNQGPHFSAGANLALLLMYAIEQEYDEIDMMIRHFQNTMMGLRYCGVPVVAAPHGMTLGGGCELSLHADQLQIAAETYIGMVEFGVGLIPAGGGSKEMTLRASDAYHDGDIELSTLKNNYLTIGMAKVSTSAHEAYDLGIIRRGDKISMNKNRQIADAKNAVLDLANAGYAQPTQRKDIKVLGKAGLGMFLVGAHAMYSGRYISEHDKKISEKLAYVMCGGELSAPALVSEQYLLDLEREAFLSLCGEKKTLERIQSILTTGKPLRN